MLRYRVTISIPSGELSGTGVNKASLLTRLIISVGQNPLETDSGSDVQKFTAFHGNQASLPCSQEPVTGANPEADESSPLPFSLKINFNIILQSTPVSPKWVFRLKYCLNVSSLSHARYMSHLSHPP
jgi:hypothetical protein